MKIVLFVVFGGVAFLYCWLRLGPVRCPACRTLNLGVFGPHVGIRRMHFHCRRCGERYRAHPRLPL